MGARVDHEGLKYGKLTALSAVIPRKGRTFWLCRCDCGVEKEVAMQHVVAGKIVSCGCYLTQVLHSDKHASMCKTASQMPRTHGLSRKPEYFVWKAMRQRCQNSKSKDYRWYGALGVKVCDRWKEFVNFYADMGDANGLTLDRVDVFGNYSPENCKWVTWAEQRQNKRIHAANKVA